MRWLLPLILASCAPNGLGAVPRYPFIEDRGLALRHETLELDVARDGAVAVSALFQFETRGDERERVMTFPIGSPRGGAEGFVAELVGSSRASLPAERAVAGALPVGSAVESWDLWVGARALTDNALRVRYTQRGSGAFGYVLKSGAYWAGPIERLEVILRDPHARVAAAFIEGRRVALAERETVVTLVNVEPDEGVRLELE